MPERSVRSPPRAIPVALLLLGCFASTAAAQPSPPPDACSTQLLVDWPQAHRKNLVARLRQGVVPVQLSGCTMSPVDGCQIDGGYAWVPQPAPSSQEEPIPDGDSGATLRTLIAGKLQAGGSRRALNPACSGATHLIDSVQLGAFEIRAADGSVVSALGTPGQCVSSPGTPPEGCSEVVRARLTAFSVPPVAQEPVMYVRRMPGLFATGVTFTTLGGMAIVTGITFTAVGCSDPERGGMCTAGLITLASGILVTPIAIWMIVAGLPTTVYVSGDTQVMVGPTFVAGRF